jgi:hypothetical protein
MTEAEWLKFRDPEKMLEYLRGRASERKLRLFACACCRAMDRRGNISGLDVVALAERVAEGHLRREEAALTAARVRCLAWDCRALDLVSLLARWFASKALTWRVVPRVALLRCIAGNPFHAVSLAPAVLASQSGTVVRMATSIYEGRCWEDMPLLGDALEEAGCTDQAVLDHCRGPGPHARGCFVVDAILERS